MNMQQSFTQAFDLSDEVVAITGGGTGLGFGMAQCLVQSGAKVALMGRRQGVLEKAVEQLGDRASYYVHDVRDFASARGVIETITSKVGLITTLINNAGNHLKKRVEETESKDFETILGTHVLGAFELSKAVIPPMKAANHGHILFTASMASLFGIPQVVAYSAAKSALLGIVRTMATELSPDGIRVNAIAPGWIESEMSRKAMNGDQERRDKVLARTPMRQFGQAEDIGWAAVYLCSPAARFVTGVCLPVDGGVSIGF
jgi:gluconate 5-dehydrogenase